MLRRTRPALVASLPFLLAALAAIAPSPARAGSTDAPIPAPGSALPDHAAGGWPTELTGDDKKPQRTPEQQANLDAVTAELARLAKSHGPDSVVLQSKLLMRSTAAGAVGPVEVKVAGASPVAGADHLEIDVETGLYFDSRSTTPESRRDAVWKDVAVPVLDEMKSFRIEPAALELVLLYDVQEAGKPATADEVASFDPTAPSVHEAVRVRLGRALLDGIASDAVAADAMRDGAVFSPEAPAPRLAAGAN